MLDWPSQHVIVTGGNGFLGRSVVRALVARGVSEQHIFIPRSTAFDLREPGRCRMLMDAANDATLIIHCAGLVGGLGLNRAHPAGMLHDNLVMSLNLIEAAVRSGFAARPGTRFVAIGSMTSYPASAPLPYREESLFAGLPDPEIASYGVAKLAVLQALRAYRAEFDLKSAMPILVNLYGPGDNIDDEARSHVAGALMRRFVDAANAASPEVICWGTGSPTRDFVFVDDAADGVLRAAEVIDDASPVNIASGKEVSIRALAELIAHLAGFKGRITWDASKGDGVSRRCLDITRARERLGWGPRVGLEEGMRRAIEWYRAKRA